MSESSPFLPPSSPPPLGAAPAAASVMDAKEINDGKVLAALGYPIWIVALVVLLVRNNAFSLFHAKQMMTLTIVQLVLSIPLFGCFCIGGLLMPGSSAQNNAGPAVALGVGVLLVWLIYIAMAIVCLVLIIIGLINAVKGEVKPLPLIGGLAERLFRNVHKQAT